MIHLSINSRDVEVAPGATVWEAAGQIGVDIPVLCHSPKMRPVGYDEVVALALSGIDERRSVRIEVDEQLPAVLADVGLLERVVANVVDNALRHGRESVGGSVAVRGSAYGGQVELRVVDEDGRPGVPEDVGGLLRSARRIDPDDDCADRHHGPVGRGAVRPVAAI